MTSTKILAFAGSARRDSFNKKLVKIATEGARAAGAEVTYLDFRDLPLPYDEDLEEAEGLPDNALRLKALMKTPDWISNCLSRVQQFNYTPAKKCDRLGIAS